MRRFFLEKKIIKFHKFCVEPVTSLPKDIQNKLIDYFTTQESKLLRGFPRSILIDIGIEEAWFEPIDK